MRGRTLWSRWIETPCAFCALEAGAPTVCRGCAEDVFDDGRRCPRCALSLAGEADSCARCLRDPPCFDATIAVADYAPPIDGMILALKFGHRLELAAILGTLLAERARRTRTELPARIVPVPLAFDRLAERGFNQALEIARAAAHALDAQLDAGAVVRVRHCAPQASLRLDARRRNVRGAFVARGDLAGTTIAVVDDVMTSGSTLEEIARVLKAAGVRQVVNLVVARTP